MQMAWRGPVPKMSDVKEKILVVDAGAQEMNHLAAALAADELLSRYVRPYARVGRKWESTLTHAPFGGRLVSRSLERRGMPRPLAAENITEAARLWDVALALSGWLPASLRGRKTVRGPLVRRLTNAVAKAGARAFSEEWAVVASWGCAEPAFLEARSRGATCVLNYPLAHHAYTQRFLQEEARREPDFSGTLNSHDLPGKLIRRLEREIELADRVLVGSSFVKDTFVEEGVPESKIEVLPYGADVSIFKPNTEGRNGRSRFRMVFAGQISQRKGLSYLLRAFDLVSDDESSLTLVGGLQDDGSALRPWLGKVEHVPRVAKSTLADIFARADVFVFPTLVEGMPIVVLEAMASGLPVVTTANGPGDIVRDGIEGFIVPVRDPRAIADKLQILRGNPSLRAQMGRNARLRAEGFSWRVYRCRAIACLRGMKNEVGIGH